MKFFHYEDAGVYIKYGICSCGSALEKVDALSFEYMKCPNDGKIYPIEEKVGTMKVKSGFHVKSLLKQARRNMYEQERR